MYKAFLMRLSHMNNQNSKVGLLYIYLMDAIGMQYEVVPWCASRGERCHTRYSFPRVSPAGSTDEKY